MLQAGVDGLAEETFPMTANDQSPGILIARLDRIPVRGGWSRHGDAESDARRRFAIVSRCGLGRPAGARFTGAGGHNTRRLKADAS